MNSTKLRLWVDGGMGAALLAAVASGLALWQGNAAGADRASWDHARHVWGALHAFSGAAMVLGTAAHLLMHWGWIKGAVRSMKTRGSFWIDGGLLILLLGVLASAPEGAHGTKDLQASAAFLLHWTGSLALAGLTLVHLGLHRAWLTSALRRR